YPRPYQFFHVRSYRATKTTAWDSPRHMVPTATVLQPWAKTNPLKKAVHRTKSLEPASDLPADDVPLHNAFHAAGANILPARSGRPPFRAHRIFPKRVRKLPTLRPSLPPPRFGRNRFPRRLAEKSKHRGDNTLLQVFRLRFQSHRYAIPQRLIQVSDH